MEIYKTDFYGNPFYISSINLYIQENYSVIDERIQITVHYRVNNVKKYVASFEDYNSFIRYFDTLIENAAKKSNNKSRIYLNEYDTDSLELDVRKYITQRLPIEITEVEIKLVN